MPPPPAPALPTRPATDPAQAPAHAPLQEVGGKYIGPVADRCPWGGGHESPDHAVPTLKDTDYKLVGGTLEITLPYNGCPAWAGYTVVTGPGSPMPFYVCLEAQHDPCESDGVRTWVFDISAQLKANNATAVEFSVPSGVY